VFDSLAALVRVCCSTNATMVPIFMKVLLPAFQPILANGESDFYPCVFVVVVGGGGGDDYDVVVDVVVVVEDDGVVAVAVVVL
jgi:hypothetical protein